MFAQQAFVLIELGWLLRLCQLRRAVDRQQVGVGGPGISGRDDRELAIAIDRGAMMFALFFNRGCGVGNFQSLIHVVLVACAARGLIVRGQGFIDLPAAIQALRGVDQGFRAFGPGEFRHPASQQRFGLAGR